MDIEFIITAPAGLEAEAVGQVPLLDTAYARGAVQVGAADAQSFWFDQFGIARQQDWPAAPWRLDAQSAGDAWWLCADPVHLRLDRNQLLLDAEAATDLDDAGATSLLGLLNAHFAADGLAFHAVAPHQWVLRVPRSLDLSTTPPHLAAGRPAALTQPAGADAPWARRLANEAQMVLHQSAHNAVRESDRQAPLNSLWLWGGGTRAGPVATALQAMTIASPAKHVRELAGAAGHRVLQSEADWRATLPLLHQTHTPKALIDLTEIPADGDWATRLERDWLKPAQSSAQAENMRFWSTLLCSDGNFKTRLYHRDLFHFLRRKSLAHYIDKRQN
jgi:hypothetical protein